MGTLRDLVKQVRPINRPQAEQLVTELTFMRGQLAKLRKEVREKGCTELFVQGRQEVERLTPAFQAYTTLVTKFDQLHRHLTALLPDDDGDQGDEMDEFIRELRGLK